MSDYEEDWSELCRDNEHLSAMVFVLKDDVSRLTEENGKLRKLLDATMGAFAIHADRYQRDYGLDGLHPTHYDILKECGGRMDDFKRATNAKVVDKRIILVTLRNHHSRHECAELRAASRDDRAGDEQQKDAAATNCQDEADYSCICRCFLCTHRESPFRCIVCR